MTRLTRQRMRNAVKQSRQLNEARSIEWTHSHSSA